MKSSIRYCCMAFWPDKLKESESFTTYLITPFILNYGLLVYFLELIRRNQDIKTGIFSNIPFMAEFYITSFQCFILTFLGVIYLTSCGYWWNNKLETLKYRCILTLLGVVIFDWLCMIIYLPIRMSQHSFTIFDYVVLKAFLAKIIVDSVQIVISLVILPCRQGREIRKYCDLVETFFS